MTEGPLGVGLAVHDGRGLISQSLVEQAVTREQNASRTGKAGPSRLDCTATRMRKDFGTSIVRGTPGLKVPDFNSLSRRAISSFPALPYMKLK